MVFNIYVTQVLNACIFHLLDANVTNYNRNIHTQKKLIKTAKYMCGKT